MASAKRQEQRSRARDLLRRLIDVNRFTAEQLSLELVVPSSALEKYLDGSQPIPVDRQLVLAAFVVEKVPSLARAGHKLRGQAEAMIRFNAGETQVHRDGRVAPLK